ncbi:MAG: hypothetical protein K0S55_443 [Clostridia bacterium]|nr:hypothetical protein [Clostridia bacterium]
MSNKAIGKCPLCEGRLTVSRLSCKKCNIDITGDFELNKFSYLDKEDLDFVETFLKCQGNLKDLQNSLGISYPTAKKQLDNVLNKLGYNIPVKNIDKIENIDILSRIEAGEITAKEAIEIIKSQTKN